MYQTMFLAVLKRKIIRTLIRFTPLRIDSLITFHVTFNYVHETKEF